MKRTSVFLFAVFCCAVAAASFAATDNNVGKWKLNESKSKLAAGAAKNNTVEYTAESGGSYKCVTDGVDGTGKPMTTEWTGKFDGKDYPVTGDAGSETRSVQKVDARHYKIGQKKGGKTTMTGTIAFSADGKTRTLTTNGTDAGGKKFTSVAVYDKQ